MIIEDVAVCLGEHGFPDEVVDTFVGKCTSS